MFSEMLAEGDTGAKMASSAAQNQVQIRRRED